MHGTRCAPPFSSPPYPAHPHPHPRPGPTHAARHPSPSTPLATRPDQTWSTEPSRCPGACTQKMLPGPVTVTSVFLHMHQVRMHACRQVCTRSRPARMGRTCLRGRHQARRHRVRAGAWCCVSAGRE